MRTPEEIKYSIEKQVDSLTFYEALMLEIMCNIAITLDKIQKEMNK